MESSREAFAGQVQGPEWVADATIFDSRIVDAQDLQLPNED